MAKRTNATLIASVCLLALSAALGLGGASALDAAPSGPAALSSTATVDSGGNVGAYTDIAIGTDGLPLIAYFGATTNRLKVAHCNDAACSGGDEAINTVDASTCVGVNPSIAIGTDGRGLISYWDCSNLDLKVAHCNNAACTSATPATLDSTGNVGVVTSIAIGADGLGLISYNDGTNADLKAAHCDNVACTGATTVTLDSAGDVGGAASIAIGSDGLGLISYFDSTNGDLKVAHCTNAACTSATKTTLDGAGFVAVDDTSIAIGADGFGLISYYDYIPNHNLKVAHCSNAACTSATLSTVDAVGDVGHYSSIAKGADNKPVISYYDATNGDLKIAHCNDAACAGGDEAILTLDSAGDVGRANSLRVGTDLLPVISYYDATNGDLKAAHCTDPACVPQLPPVLGRFAITGGSGTISTGGGLALRGAVGQLDAGLVKGGPFALYGGYWFRSAVVTRGNCNHDATINAGDLSALPLEVFDGDGVLASAVAGGTFAGDPVGCDANADGWVDAGDVSCTVLELFGGLAACE